MIATEDAHRSSAGCDCRRHPFPANYSRILSAVIVTLVTCSSLTGCVFRRMTIRSDPPQALALVDGEEVGYTPVSLDHTYYGTREITLIKPGYETLTVMQKIQTPWYQYLPIDFVADNLWPFKVTDRHDYSYSLQKQLEIGNQDLIDRANSHRNELQAPE